MNKVFIIAEAGVNHNGNLNLARKLIAAAKLAGADAVKFQSFSADKLVAASTPKAGYQKQTTNKDETQHAMIKRLELSLEDHQALIKECRRQRIQFLSTPFDEGSADLLEKLGVKIFKIPSGEITNIPFLEFLARKRKPLILSTGMSNLVEIKEAVQSIFKAGNKKLTLLHCVTEYPAPFNQLNLKAIQTLLKEFRLTTGFSDHSLGVEASIAAVSLGAVVIEKHLTLGRDLPGPDHKASLEPEEFKTMVQTIRHIEQALGDGKKQAMPCEKKYIDLVRKSVVANKVILKGEKISNDHIAMKRPGHGIQPKEVKKVIGRRAKRTIQMDDVILWKDLK
jgi:N,N'-diacetyllegionaminate synthase